MPKLRENKILENWVLCTLTRAIGIESACKLVRVSRKNCQKICV